MHVAMDRVTSHNGRLVKNCARNISLTKLGLSFAVNCEGNYERQTN